MSQRLTFLSTTIISALSAIGIVSATAAEGDLLGQGAYQYKVEAGWGDVSTEKIQLNDCHAMRMDSKGRMVMVNNGGNNNVIIYDKTGKMVETWGTTFPGVHGLAIVQDKSGESLWLTDHDRHQVIKTSMDGKELKVMEWPEGVPPYTAKDQYKPTDIEFGDKGDFYVFDGYGQAMILHYGTDGKLIRAFGGGGDQPDKLSTPHGGVIDRRDPKKPVLLVASRGHHTIKRFTLDGDYIDSQKLPGAEVCDVFILGSDLYVPNLNGYVTILDQNNKVVSNVAGTPPVYNDKGELRNMKQVGNTFIHPHNLFVDAEGSIYVAQWASNGTHPIKLVRQKAK
jgi:peptidylamidoglycolate lyase